MSELKELLNNLKRKDNDMKEEIDEEGTVTGIVCKECGNELPEHTVKDHKDINHPVHKCPHKLEEI